MSTHAHMIGCPLALYETKGRQEWKTRKWSNKNDVKRKTWKYTICVERKRTRGGKKKMIAFCRDRESARERKGCRLKIKMRRPNWTREIMFCTVKWGQILKTIKNVNFKIYSEFTRQNSSANRWHEKITTKEECLWDKKRIKVKEKWIKMRKWNNKEGNNETKKLLSFVCYFS